MIKNSSDMPDNKLKLNIRDILDALPFYVLLIDENHYILEANNAVYKQLGVKRKDILGRYCPKVIHGLDSQFPGCPLEEAVAKNTSVEKELLDKRSGRWLMSSVYPTGALTPAKKKIYFHMVTDITERKEAQEQAVIAHERLRQTLAHLESVREEERREIARNLHDETSQQVASLYAHLEAAIGQLSADEDKTITLLRKAQSMATTVLDEIHNLIYELRPSIIDELGLVPATRYMAEKHLKEAGIKVSLKTTGRVRRLPSSLEVAIFRVIQESLNNTERHAHATKAIIELSFKKDSIRVSIKDNGIGFNVQEVVNSKDKYRGLGLLGIRERVDLMNGSLVINSSPGNGTEIVINVPVNREQAHG
jgi:PAS domain S-box-containing protein